jgi:hypothetical protein
LPQCDFPPGYPSILQPPGALKRVGDTADMKWNQCRAWVAVAVLALGACLPARAQDDEDAGQFGALVANGESVHGTITAIHGNDLTLKDEEGQVYQVETGPNPYFRKEDTPIRLGDLKPGDIVFAAGEEDPKNHALGAVFVIEIDPKTYQEARSTFGKTWTAGKVTAVHDLSITIERPDHVSQVITVDENTSFRKRRDSVTLADVTVGESISAKGALDHGKFRATVLAIDPRGQRLPTSAGPQ